MCVGEWGVCVGEWGVCVRGERVGQALWTALAQMQPQGLQFSKPGSWSCGLSARENPRPLSQQLSNGSSFKYSER